MFKPDPDAPIGELITHLIADGKAYAVAEVAVVKQTALAKVQQVKPAAIYLVVAVFIVQAALTILLAALGLGLASWLTPAGGMAVAGVIGLAIAGSLAWLAVRILTGKSA